MLCIGCTKHSIEAIILAKTDLLANSNLTHFYTILRLYACEIIITMFTFIFERIFKRVLKSLASRQPVLCNSVLGFGLGH